MVMTTREVPAAYSMGRASASTSAGTTRNPPPTPRKPVSSPITVAVTSTLRARGHWQAKVGLKLMIGSSSLARAGQLPGAGSPATHLAHDHGPADHEHQDREGREQHRFGDEGGGPGSRDRAADGHEPEGHAAAEQHVPGPVRRHRAEQRGHGDDDEGSRRRLRRALPEGVDEHRNGEDRATTAERAQAQADERAGDDRDEDRGHAAPPVSGPTRWSPTFSALSKESSTATSVRPAASRTDAATDAR